MCHTIDTAFLKKMKKRSERRKHCARAGCSKVRTPPARPLSQTHRHDRLQYTAPQLASAQCNNSSFLVIISSTSLEQIASNESF